MNEQPSLLEWVPPDPYPGRGDTFIPSRDGKRLGDQAYRVYRVMRSGEWQTLYSIAAVTCDPEASVSARLRDLRRFGFVIERAYAGNGLHKYRLVK